MHNTLQGKSHFIIDTYTYISSVPIYTQAANNGNEDGILN